MLRRSLVFLLISLPLAACGGSTSTLHTLGTPSGSDIRFDVENKTSAVINNLYIAPTAKVKAAPRSAFEPGPDQASLWGDELLSSGLEVGGKVSVKVPGAGGYDVRVV